MDVFFSTIAQYLFMVRVNLVVKHLLLSIGLMLSMHLPAQELLRNGGFEEKTYCPTDFNTQTLKTVKYWTQPNRATPDYFNECSKNAGVPRNFVGSQDALEGQGYVGLVTYAGSKRNYREYLQTELSRKLAPGELVCVEFWVSCADYCLYVTDGLGVLFSQGAVKASGEGLIDERPQIRNPRLHMLDQYDSWVKLSDVFVAQGGEKYLTIGNFNSDQTISRLMRTALDGGSSTSSWAYVYIDNIEVHSVKSRDECSCLNDKIAAEVHDPPLQLTDYTEIKIESVLFDFDEAILSDEAKILLDQAASLLRRNKYMFVQVNGHTDLIGVEGYNVELSENRAETVRRYLVDQGIDPARLELGFFGSTIPVADNDTAEGRAANRRVEFKVLERKFVMAN